MEIFQNQEMTGVFWECVNKCLGKLGKLWQQTWSANGSARMKAMPM